MSYINMILFIISIICLLISLYILVKSIYVAIMRAVKIKNIYMDEVESNNANTVYSIRENENVRDSTPLNNIIDICNPNNIHLTLVDYISGKAIKSIEQFPCIVGRGVPADVIIDSDKAISKRHVVFTYENGKIFVSDLQSSNGTLINGNKIFSECVVRNGDIMKIGRTQIELVINP